MQAEQRDPVGEDVVHLAGDAPSLGLPGQLGAPSLLGIEALGPGPEREDHLTPGADQDPPAEGDRGRHEAGEALAQGIGPRGPGYSSGRTAPADQGQQRDRGQDAAPPAHLAVLNMATSAAPWAKAERILRPRRRRLTAPGRERRSHNARHATEPKTRSMAFTTPP